LTIVPPSLPFHWQGKVFTITECGIRNDRAYAAVTPHNPKLVAELKQRIQQERALSLYLCAGYVRFADKYPTPIFSHPKR
jgi:hypothetical protein